MKQQPKKKSHSQSHAKKKKNTLLHFIQHLSVLAHSKYTLENSSILLVFYFTINNMQVKNQKILLVYIYIDRYSTYVSRVSLHFLNSMFGWLLYIVSYVLYCIVLLLLYCFDEYNIWLDVSLPVVLQYHAPAI